MGFSGMNEALLFRLRACHWQTLEQMASLYSARCIHEADGIGDAPKKVWEEAQCDTTRKLGGSLTTRHAETFPFMVKVSPEERSCLDPSIQISSFSMHLVA